MRFKDFALALSSSGLKSHGDLRTHLMEKMGLGHGHASAVIRIWREFDGGNAKISGGSGAPAKRAAKPVLKKAAAKPKKKK